MALPLQLPHLLMDGAGGEVTQRINFDVMVDQLGADCLDIRDEQTCMAGMESCLRQL